MHSHLVFQRIHTMWKQCIKKHEPVVHILHHELHDKRKRGQGHQHGIIFRVEKRSIRTNCEKE